MGRPTGNRQLKVARLARGLRSQEALAAALNDAATDLGLRGVTIGQRQIRRWESSSPPWPHPHHQQLLVHVLGLEIAGLGFTPPWDVTVPAGVSAVSGRGLRADSIGRAVGTAGRLQPDTIVGDFLAVTRAHRRMYRSVAPGTLHPAVVEHARLGVALMRSAEGSMKQAVSEPLAESILLAGRMEFFDLRDADAAAESFVRAFRFAGEADAQRLGTAVLGHAAFVPGWSGDRAGANERMSAARAYARRSDAPPVMWAWLDAVDAECASRCGDLTEALRLLDRARSTLDDDYSDAPEWFDWFDRHRLAAFTGNAQLRAGHLRAARSSLEDALSGLTAKDVKQRSVVLADLAAVDAQAGDVAAACVRATEALQALSVVWYAAGMERGREVRRALRPVADSPQVRELDDLLYTAGRTVSA